MGGSSAANGSSSSNTGWTWTAENYSPAQLSQFGSSQAAAAWTPEQIQSLSGLYQGTSSNSQYGTGYTTGVPQPGTAGPADYPSVDPNLVAAYQTWLAGQNQTQQNWTSYSEQVAAAAGGEGDNTTTAGASVSQRNALLGTLANPNNPTSPTVGLGTMGSNAALLKKNGVALGTGVAK